jgi:SAM-dependent methyltransferase
MSSDVTMKPLLRRSGRVLRRVGLALERAGDAETAVMAAPGMDLTADSDEGFYADEYLHWLRPHLNGQECVLDVGCGAGRLTARVAEALPDAQVTGIDLSAGKLAYARQWVGHLQNVELVEADATEWLPTVAPGSVALVLFTEVDFFAPKHDMLAQIAAAIRPGGLLFASFRSQWFNLAQSVRLRDFESAATVRDTRTGTLWKTPYRFRWYTPADIREALDEVDLTVETLRGIGVLSGREHDALDILARPAALTEPERRMLLDLETSLAAEYADCGRYIAAVARRRS